MLLELDILFMIQFCERCADLALSMDSLVLLCGEFHRSYVGVQSQNARRQHS